jgi:hypothetical protein
MRRSIAGSWAAVGREILWITHARTIQARTTKNAACGGVNEPSAGKTIQAQTRPRAGLHFCPTASKNSKYKTNSNDNSAMGSWIVIPNLALSFAMGGTTAYMAAASVKNVTKPSSVTR